MKRQLIPDHMHGPIRIAAKSGFLTKRIWIEFFSTGNRRWQNRRWHSLIETGILKCVPDYGFVDSVVTLSDAGKSLATNLGMNPVYSPHAKNLWHDEELIRFALFLERRGWISNWATEQELNVGGAGAKFFNHQDRAKKIPDLIIEWNTPKDKIFWAIELERTRKEFSRYYEMVGAYKGISKIDSVFVIAATNTIEANIKKALAKMGYPQNERPMLFASMNQVIENPAMCELRNGSNSITLAKMANALTGKKYVKPFAEVKTTGPGDGPDGAYLCEAV